MAARPRKAPAKKAASKSTAAPADQPKVHTLTEGKTRRHLVAGRCPSGVAAAACPDCKPDGTCNGVRFAPGVEV